MSIKTFAVWTPAMPSRIFSESLLIVAGTLGSFVASASCTLTSPLSMLTDLTRPNDTISREKPGYFTDVNASLTCSSETDMFQTYPRQAAGKPGKQPWFKSGLVRCTLVLVLLFFLAFLVMLPGFEQIDFLLRLVYLNNEPGIIPFAAGLLCFDVNGSLPFRARDWD